MTGEKNIEDATYESAETNSREERRKNWFVAFGLQDVDDLKPSDYAVKLANAHISGEMSINEVEETIRNYYTQKENAQKVKERQDESDIVSSRIVRILDNNSFSNNENSLKNIHKILFKGFDNYCHGKYRQCDIIKAEWVLDNDTVQYCHFENIEDDVALAFNKEEHFNYIETDEKQTVIHIADFISNLWQIHPFLEGNTRTTAVFAIKYLRHLGYDIDNTPFEKNAKYFRGALVRANYKNNVLKVNKDISFINMFFENILLGKNNNLQNRTLHIHWTV